tara:strand:+ start:5563 stop:5805 length:243 start_codon:yes stop_codon:yes gene_type:complete
MSRRKKRIFIITLEIKNKCWDYNVGDVIQSAVISNNMNNAVETFRDKHEGSEYPFYDIKEVYDTYDNGIFMPKISSSNLM